MSFCTRWLVVQMYVIGYFKKGQRGSRSTRWPFNLWLACWDVNRNKLQLPRHEANQYGRSLSSLSCSLVFTHWYVFAAQNSHNTHIYLVHSRNCHQTDQSQTFSVLCLFICYSPSCHFYFNRSFIVGRTAINYRAAWRMCHVGFSAL